MYSKGYEKDEYLVSILVLMDAPLESWLYGFFAAEGSGFNPCFNGCAS